MSLTYSSYADTTLFGESITTVTTSNTTAHINSGDDDDDDDNNEGLTNLEPTATMQQQSQVDGTSLYSYGWEEKDKKRARFLHSVVAGLIFALITAAGFGVLFVMNQYESRDSGRAPKESNTGRFAPNSTVDVIVDSSPAPTSTDLFPPTRTTMTLNPTSSPTDAPSTRTKNTTENFTSAPTAAFVFPAPTETPVGWSETGTSAPSIDSAPRTSQPSPAPRTILDPTLYPMAKTPSSPPTESPSPAPSMKIVNSTATPTPNYYPNNTNTTVNYISTLTTMIPSTTPVMVADTANATNGTVLVTLANSASNNDTDSTSDDEMQQDTGPPTMVPTSQRFVSTTTAPVAVSAATNPPTVTMAAASDSPPAPHAETSTQLPTTDLGDMMTSNPTDITETNVPTQMQTMFVTEVGSSAAVVEGSNETVENNEIVTPPPPAIVSVNDEQTSLPSASLSTMSPTTSPVSLAPVLG